MTVVLKTDSDRYVHQLWAQEQASSCAVASIWMARNQARQQTVDESEWSLAWSIYSEIVQPMPLSTTPRPEPAPRTFNPSGYQSNQLTMGNMFANFGTFMNQVAAKLRMDGLNADVSASSVVNPARLADDKPAIILLGWYSGGKRNGGHFIVAARVTSSGKIVYLDPWGGQLNELGVGPGYQATGKFEQIAYISARH
jgi:hypothetical protein